MLSLLSIFLPFFLGLQLAYPVKLLAPDPIQLLSHLWLFVFFANILDQLPREGLYITSSPLRVSANKLILVT